MFVKISENRWINLTQCASIEIQENESGNWEIDFHSDTERSGSIGTFRSESEAHEVLDEIWEYSREGKPYFEPDPRKKLNVRLEDKWYADDEPVQTYLEAIQRLGLEKIEARGMTFKDRNVPTHEGYLIVTKDNDPKFKQSQAGEYYILRLERPTTMKETLERIASELGVEIKVTIYQE